MSCTTYTTNRKNICRNNENVLVEMMNLIYSYIKKIISFHCSVEWSSSIYFLSCVARVREIDTFLPFELPMPRHHLIDFGISMREVGVNRNICM
jgi:hypothetical protein